MPCDRVSGTKLVPLSECVGSEYITIVLEMHNGVREICTQISAQGTFWGGYYQQWYLIPYEQGYILKSKHYPGEDWVMDLHGAFSDDDTVIQINKRNNSPAQIWSIYKGDDVQLKGPILTITPGTSATPTKFTWTRSYGATTYNLRVFKDEIWEGEDHSLYEVSSGCEMILPEGNHDY